MDALQKGILTLIRSAVTEQPLPLPAEFELEQALPMILRHGIQTLCYDGAVRCGVDKKNSAMQELFRRYCQLLRQSEQQMCAVERLFAEFDREGIDYMPLKGCCMKRLYSKPELRPMGDADILIRTDQYDQVRPVVERLGYEEVVESDHELIWHNNALHLELHKRLIPSYNQDYYRYFGDGWRLAEPISGSRYGMKPEDEFVYLFAHFAKHYRDGGIGIRQASDLWVFLKAYPELNKICVEAELEKLRLLEFYRNVCRMLLTWFEDETEDEKTEFISQFIFRSGSWGSKVSHMISTGVKNTRSTGSISEGRWKRIRDGLFPNLLIMKQKYPVLKKYPLFLPVFWPVRWIAAILFRRDNLRRQHQELKITSPERIETYQQGLSYVGLDFHFEE